MRRESHVRMCERGGVKLPSATRPIVGFEHHHDAERFLTDLEARLTKFELALHPDKTRLIRFGRTAIADRRAEGLGKPATFDFLGFMRFCATRRSGTGFVLGRTPARKRLRAKLREIRDRLRATRHDGVDVQGQWLKPRASWLAFLLCRANECTQRSRHSTPRNRALVPRHSAWGPEAPAYMATNARCGRPHAGICAGGDQ